MRVVIDTNSFIVTIGRRSRFRPIFDALQAGLFTLLVTNEIVKEYEEVLGDRTNGVVAYNIVELLRRSPNVELVNVYFKWQVIVADADDDKFADCAFNGDADAIVTDDKHFDVLDRLAFPEMTVLKTEAFLAEVTELLSSDPKAV